MNRRVSRACTVSSGFTLVELLVAMLIAALFFAGAVPLFANALRATSSDTERVDAQSIAQQLMERIRELPFNQLSNLDSSYNTGTDLTTWMGGEFNPTVKSYVGTSSKTYTVGYLVTFTPATASALNAQYAQVKVTVSWADVSGATAYVKLATVISRQFSGPAVSNVTLSPMNGAQQLAGGTTVITVYIPPAQAGSGNSNVKSVNVVIADVNNASFTPVTLVATPVSNGVFSASWGQSGATSNDTYSFTAQAIAPDGSPGNSFSATAKLVTGQNPAPVSGFTIQPGNQCLLLTWNNSTASDFAHYEIWSGTSPANMTQLVASIQASGYIDTGLTNGTTYYYEVRVVDNQGNDSPWVTGQAVPAIQTDTTLPGMPIGFTATRSGPNADLTWTAPAAGTSGIAGYFVYRDGGAQPYARVGANAIIYSDIIGYSIAHTYSMVAFDNVGLVSSSTLTVTVPVATAPTYSLKVTTIQASGVSIDVVQTDAQPVPQDDGTQTATRLQPAAWDALPYGSYTITATYGSQQIIQTITLNQNMTVSSGL